MTNNGTKKEPAPGPNNGKDSVTLVIFNGELDKAIAAFVIATAAASMSMKVNMFFTFWGLNVIKKEGGLIRGNSWFERMLNLMNRGSAKRLALSKLNMAGAGPAMLKAMMAGKKVPSLPEFIDMAHKLGVSFYPCEMSMRVMGLAQEDFIDECEEVIGAVSYLTLAKESNINLFI